MKKEIYVIILCLFLIVDGELSILFGDISVGMSIYVTGLLAIMFVIFSDISIDVKNIFQCMILLILLQMASLSIQQIYTTTLLQYVMIYGVVLIPIFTIIRNQKLSSMELGISLNKLYVYIPISIVIGIMAGMVEYKILNPSALIDQISSSNIFLITVVMFFIATVEGLIFRSVLQTRIERVFGLKYGILLSGTIFGIMYIANGLLNEVVFEIMFGTFLAYIFQKTRSIPFTISIQGVANIMLFGILPLLKF